METLDLSQGSRRTISNDAWDWLTQWFNQLNVHESENYSVGVLIAGPPGVGKTKMALEWLRQERGHEHLLIPHPERNVPHPWAGDNAWAPLWLFLDDLHNMTEEQLESVNMFLSKAEISCLPVRVLATAWSGADASGYSEYGAGRRLLERLQVIHLEGPKAADIEELVAIVGDEAGIRDKTVHDGTFYILEGSTFKEQEKRIKSLISSDLLKDKHAIALLYAGRELAIREIPIRTKKFHRWQKLAYDFFNGPAPEDFDRAVQNLHDNHLMQGPTPDPGTLTRVLYPPIIAPSEEHIRLHFLDRSDGHALFLWGLTKMYKGGDDGFEIACQGASILQEGDVKASATIWFTIGAVSCKLPNHHNTEKALKQAINIIISFQDVESIESAARFHLFFGLVQCKNGNYGKESEKLFQGAIALGSQADTKEALESAAVAAFVLGTVYKEGKKRQQEVINLWTKSMLWGEASNSSDGLESAALAALGLSHIIKDNHHIRRLLNQAMTFGEQSNKEYGLESAAKAAMKLTFQIVKKGYYNQELLPQALALARRAGTSDCIKIIETIERIFSESQNDSLS